MTRCVWKYPLALEREGPDDPGISTTVRLPDRVRARHVGLDPSGHPCVWIELDPDAPAEDVRLTIIVTGQEIPEGAIYLGSFVAGGFVGHVFSTEAVG